MNEIQMLIGGQQRAASNGATFERRNPLDHSVATRAPAATVADAQAAVEAAAQAFPAWAASSGTQRATLLRGLARLLAPADCDARLFADPFRKACAPANREIEFVALGDHSAAPLRCPDDPFLLKGRERCTHGVAVDPELLGERSFRRHHARPVIET